MNRYRIAAEGVQDENAVRSIDPLANVTEVADVDRHPRRAIAEISKQSLITGDRVRLKHRFRKRRNPVPVRHSKPSRRHPTDDVDGLGRAVFSERFEYVSRLP